MSGFRKWIQSKFFSISASLSIPKLFFALSLSYLFYRMQRIYFWGLCLAIENEFCLDFSLSTTTLYLSSFPSPLSDCLCIILALSLFFSFHSLCHAVKSGYCLFLSFYNKSLSVFSSQLSLFLSVSVSVSLIYFTECKAFSFGAFVWLQKANSVWIFLFLRQISLTLSLLSILQNAKNLLSEPLSGFRMRILSKFLSFYDKFLWLCLCYLFYRMERI